MIMDNRQFLRSFSFSGHKFKFAYSYLKILQGCFNADANCLNNVPKTDVDTTFFASFWRKSKITTDHNAIILRKHNVFKTIYYICIVCVI